ncbi:MAG: DUF2971 domain-containing protein [Eubacteriaceae bacterium]|nr:DUF2971 domain-containing protein [Eubacteriaceae bacterium]
MDWVKQFIDMIFPLYIDLMNSEGAYTLKNQHLPKSIFKYRAINKNSIKNLEEDVVWLADPSKFNDPYDCAHTVDFSRVQKMQSSELFRKFMQKQGSDLDLSEDQKKTLAISQDPLSDLMEIDLLKESPEKRETVKSSFLSDQNKRHEKLAITSSKTFVSNFKLCSFSERKDSMSMWAHYASDHHGLCVEYDLEKISPKDYRRRFMYPVIYDNKMFDATELYMKGKEDKDLNILRWHLAALVKSKDWEYEKEWRLVFPYSIIDSERSYNMGKPKMVYMGTKIRQKNQDQLAEICTRRNIPFVKMKPHHSVYKMVPCSLKDS